MLLLNCLHLAFCSVLVRLFVCSQLYAKYPDRPMILEVNNTAPMTVTCTPAVVMGHVPGSIRVMVQQADNSTIEAFALQAVGHFNA